MKESIKIGDLLELKIEKNIFGGEGLSRYNDKVVFVPMSIENEIVLAKVISVKKDYARALITKVIKPSPYRRDLPKISFEDFGACDYKMMTYEKQIEIKEKIVREELDRKYGKEYIFDEIIKSENNENYRNKVSEPFFIEDNKIKLGFYKRKSHDIFESENEYLKSKVAISVSEKLLNEINEYSKKIHKLSVFEDEKNKGTLKQLMIRNNQKNEVMIVLVIFKSNDKKHIEKILNNFIEKYDNDFKNNGINIKSIYISVKEKIDNYILGETEFLVHGDEYIEENIFDIKFKIYPKSFFQVNIEQTIKLYSKVIQYLKLTKSERVIDAYSGTGTIAMLVSKYSKKVIAIENAPQSVKSGKQTILENNIKNIEYILGKVEEKISKKILKDIDTIIFDPPRKGLDKKVIESIENINNIIYVSCNLSTFIRDLNLLKEKGYVLDRVSVVDMFPQTHHVETVALLSKLDVLISI